MRLPNWLKPNRRTEERLRLIVELDCRRDLLLKSPQPDLQALAQLADDYESAHLNYAAAALRKQLAFYRSKKP
jgi:hypothetical protein